MKVYDSHDDDDGEKEKSCLFALLSLFNYLCSHGLL